MRAFHFRLQPLLDRRDRAMCDARLIVQSMQSALSLVEERVAAIERDFRQASRTACERAFLDLAECSLRAERSGAAARRTDVMLARDAYLVAKASCDALASLKEKRLREHRLRQETIEQREIDDANMLQERRRSGKP